MYPPHMYPPPHREHAGYGWVAYKTTEGAAKALKEEMLKVSVHSLIQ
jgi:hypothetical protein